MYQRYGKRALDVLISALGILLLSPFLLAIAFVIKMDSPGPVLFKQKRFGKDKTFFTIYKFRTMRIDAPPDVPTAEMEQADRYFTPNGGWMRRTSFDELPQLFNILKGDMSVIGPRPALWDQEELIALRDQYGANGVTPGLTGWAQVNGRDELDDDVKAMRDGEYARNLSFRFDCKCFLWSVVKVFNGEGVAEGKEKKRYTEAKK